LDIASNQELMKSGFPPGLPGLARAVAQLYGGAVEFGWQPCHRRADRDKPGGSADF